jgi:hypothetical protein
MWGLTKWQGFAMESMHVSNRVHQPWCIKFVHLRNSSAAIQSSYTEHSNQLLWKLSCWFKYTMETDDGKKLDPKTANREWQSFYAGAHDEQLIALAEAEPTSLDVRTLPWILGKDALAAGNITGVFGGDALQTSRDQVLVN